ncbi:hypothetical protein niasHT_023147 [Heterodera trifolii]|uniref:Uncharacterized protein n=1 Tax=Heterodera trifolii TaxID=157864 RepID=A0ABD2JDV5_9BILA
MFSFSACCTLFAALILAAFVAVGNAQKPCSNKYMNTWKTCMQQCKSHLSVVVGNVDKLGDCLDSNSALLQSTIKCTQSHSQTAKCQSDTRKHWKLQRSGYRRRNERFDGCRQENVRLYTQMHEQQGGQLREVSQMRLELTGGQCFGAAGEMVRHKQRINIANAKALCKCAAAAGVKNLTPAVCARIRFT